jgi:hypothetical protein
MELLKFGRKCEGWIAEKRNYGLGYGLKMTFKIPVSY